MIDKFQACMLGYAIGDALAAPIEDVFRSPEEGEQAISFYVKAFPSHPVSHLDAGQYSDETQIMLILAESLVDKGCFSIDNIIKKLVDWYHSQKKRSEWRFPGNTLIKSCRKLAAGAQWNQSGHLSAGVNASCRTIPYALAYFKSHPLLKDAIEKSCRLTHTDTRAIGTAMALATVIAMGLEGEEFSPDQIMNRIIEKSHTYAPEMGKRMQMVKESLNLEPAAAIELLGNSGFCLEAFSTSLYWFLRPEKKFEDTIIGAANSGGDADAIAAMTGAMYGAWHGLGSIPERWITPLENAQKIKQLGCDMYRIAVPQG
jgi:ADP-ribosylglycohydrolase